MRGKGVEQFRPVRFGETRRRQVESKEVAGQRGRESASDVGGQAGCVKLSYLAEGVSLFEGDTVLTSGKGGAFPAGLVIGAVEEVRSDAGGQETYGMIRPSCDLANLVQVFVIKDFKIIE